MADVTYVGDKSSDDISAGRPPSYDDSCQWLSPPNLSPNPTSSGSSPSASSSSSSASTPSLTTSAHSSGGLSPNPTAHAPGRLGPHTENINGEVYFLPPKQQFAPVIYHFAQHTFNSMLLASRDSATPLYHISVHMNCFVPTSYITIICRGGTPDGEPVASFEMGLSTAKSTVTLAGCTRCTDVVLAKIGSKARRIYEWQWPADKQHHISWLCSSPVKYCYLSTQVGTPNASLLASFTPQALSPRADGAPAPPPALKLFPDGAPLADHIVLSALILERQRLSPSLSSGKPLFN
ncbi:hypothetical protein B0H21DRAFT_763903 [Amylocystis lapponica]|nr:hypothetical protein B0H21DRAFT_763903 [Amylocystis lapponica]